MTITCPSCGKPNEILEGDLLEGKALCPTCGGSLTPASTHAYASGTPPSPPDLLKPGEVLSGYVIDHLIGRGGMGSVYLATQQSLGRKVALKVLSEEFAKDPSFIQRFDREAAALADLSHPNIVSIIDKGIHNGRYYFVMEHVDGVTLREILAQRKLDASQALKLVPTLCDALEYAHSRGIVHRDIKPENLLMTKSGQLKIADFGLARLTQGDPAAGIAITQTHTVMGTRDYMAPEARLSVKGADHRADIYSLGVVFYEMLTGELPVGRFAPPSHKVQLDVRLDEVVLKTLEADPQRRYQRAGEVSRDVTQITSSPGAVSDRPGTVPPASVSPRLTLKREGRWLGGVCAGIARRYGWEPLWLRLGFVAVFLFAWFVPAASSHTYWDATTKLTSSMIGAGWLGFLSPLLYLAFWILMPKEGANPMSPPAPTSSLVRPLQGGWIAGVCAGIANRHGWEVVLVRLGFVVVTLLSCGVGLLAYLFCWIAIPKEGQTPREPGCLLILMFLVILVLAAGLLASLFLSAPGLVALNHRLGPDMVRIDQSGIHANDEQGNEVHITEDGIVVHQDHGPVTPLQVRVEQVLPGTQAERLGIQVGDRITQYDGVAIISLQQLQGLIEKNARRDAPVPLTLTRGDETLQMALQPGAIGIEGTIVAGPEAGAASTLQYHPEWYSPTAL